MNEPPERNNCGSQTKICKLQTFFSPLVRRLCSQKWKVLTCGLVDSQGLFMWKDQLREQLASYEFLLTTGQMFAVASTRLVFGWFLAVISNDCYCLRMISLQAIRVHWVMMVDRNLLQRLRHQRNWSVNFCNLISTCLKMLLRISHRTPAQRLSRSAHVILTPTLAGISQEPKMTHRPQPVIFTPLAWLGFNFSLYVLIALLNLAAVWYSNENIFYFSFDVTRVANKQTRVFPQTTSGKYLSIGTETATSNTHFFVLFYPLAYPYQDDNSVAAATADGGSPYSSPLLELLLRPVKKLKLFFVSSIERSERSSIKTN